MTFILAGSGHIAGVVNPPDKVKYQFWTDGKRSPDLQEWVKSATEHPGSWWPYWTHGSLKDNRAGWTVSRFLRLLPAPDHFSGVIARDSGRHLHAKFNLAFDANLAR